MERFRRKKLKAPVSNEGIQKVQRQRSIHNLAPDSCYMQEYLTARELDRSSSRRISGLSIKKLLTEEMSKETESKRQSPSIVARLMGLDVLPTQKPVHRQQNISKERTIYEMAEIRRNPYEGRSYMKSSRGSPKFKDVYEVSEEKGSIKSKSSEEEMNFIRQKFMDARQLSADGKFHSAEEFRDTLDVLDTNKDLLIKFLQQPDSLYTKHLHNLQGASPKSHCSHVLPISERFDDKTFVLKSKKRTSRYNNRYSREHLGSFSPNSYSPCSSNRNSMSSEIPLEGKHETEIRPTRIVVLKPNLEKLSDTTKRVQSHRRQMQYQSNSSLGEKQVGVKTLPVDVGFSRPSMRESRERAKVITRRMSRSLGDIPIDFPSIFQGYAGDESSYNVSGSDSDSELENMLSSRKSFHLSNRQNATSSYSCEPSVSQEAKKRLSKRWNISQRDEDVGSVGEISKLGEVLAKPDWKMMRDKFDPKLVPDMYRGRVSSSDIMGLGSPLSIKCRYDCKDRYARNVSKAGAFSDPSLSCYSPESSTQCRGHRQGRKGLLKEPTYQDRNKEINENVTRREDSPLRSQRSENKKPHSRYHRVGGANIVEKDQFDIKVGQNIPSEEVYLVSKMPGNNDHDPGLITETKVGVELVRKHYSCGSIDESSVKPSLVLLEINNSSALAPKDSEQQVSDIHSPLSLKDADYLSPISVLETLPAEDISSGSECFEKVSADLQELRMQLKLLRMDSRENEMNLSSSDNDDSQGPLSEIDENAVYEHATWQTTYINDVITESGFNSTDPNMILAIWHSLECPISPWVFDELEKKYSKDKAKSKSDRKLLFDRINSELVDLFWWLVDPYPWVETRRKKLSHVWWEKGVQNELEKLLGNEEKYTCEKVLDKEMEWFNFGDEIDVIGREIENLLVNDLIDKVANTLAFLGRA